MKKLKRLQIAYERQIAVAHIMGYLSCKYELGIMPQDEFLEAMKALVAVTPLEELHKKYMPVNLK